MDIVECPHCFTRVAVKPDNSCPACGMDTEQRQGTDPHKTALTVHDREVLPPFCCDCGLPTCRFVKVRQKLSGDRSDRGPLIEILVAALMFSVFPLVLLRSTINGEERGGRGRKGDVLVVRMPQCAVCASGGRPEPIRVNSEQLLLSFVVHRDFVKVHDKVKSHAGPAA